MNITNRQLFFLIFLFTEPFVIITLPKIMADSFGTGAWIFLLLMTLIYAFFAGIVAYLGYKHCDRTLFEYAQPLVGKFLTYCFAVIYTVCFFVFLASTTRELSEIIHSQVMLKTPRWIVMTVAIAAAGYAVSKGLTNLGRVLEILGVIILAISLTTRGIMASQGEILNIEPFFRISEPKKLLEKLPESLYMFSGFELMTIIPFTKRNGTKSIRAAVLAVVTTGLIYILTTETTFMILGVQNTSNYGYPMFYALRRIDIEALEFLKRFDLVFITGWIMGIFCNLSIILFALTEYLGKILKKPNNKKVLTVVCILTVISALLPGNGQLASKIGLYAAYYLSGFTMILIPSALLITSKVKEK